MDFIFANVEIVEKLSMVSICMSIIMAIVFCPAALAETAEIVIHKTKIQKSLITMIFFSIVLLASVFVLANFLSKNISNKIPLDNGRYYLQINKTNTFTLYGEGNQKTKVESSEVIDGIEIVKEVDGEVKKDVKILDIKCGNLGYNNCIEKVKANLNTIVSKLDNKEDDFKVVQF